MCFYSWKKAGMRMRHISPSSPNAASVINGRCRSRVSGKSFCSGEWFSHWDVGNRRGTTHTALKHSHSYYRLGLTFGYPSVNLQGCLSAWTARTMNADNLFPILQETHNYSTRTKLEHLITNTQSDDDHSYITKNTQHGRHSWRVRSQSSPRGALVS